MTYDLLGKHLYLHVDSKECWLWVKGAAASEFHQGSDFSVLQSKMPAYRFHLLAIKSCGGSLLVRDFFHQTRCCLLIRCKPRIYWLGKSGG